MSFETQDEINEVLSLVKESGEKGITFECIFKKCKLVYERSLLAKILHNQIALSILKKNEQDKKFVYANLESEKIEEEIKKLLAVNEEKEQIQQSEKQKIPKVITIHRQSDNNKTEMKRLEQQKIEETKNNINTVSQGLASPDNKTRLNGYLKSTTKIGKVAFIYYKASVVNKKCPMFSGGELASLVKDSKAIFSSLISILKKDGFIVQTNKIDKTNYYKWGNKYCYPFQEKKDSDNELLSEYELKYITEKEILNKHMTGKNSVFITYPEKVNVEEPEAMPEPVNENIKQIAPITADAIYTPTIKIPLDIPISSSNKDITFNNKSEMELFLDQEIAVCEHRLKQLKDIRDKITNKTPIYGT